MERFPFAACDRDAVASLAPSHDDVAGNDVDLIVTFSQRVFAVFVMLSSMMTSMARRGLIVGGGNFR
jgi:hypothetical protein